MGAKLEWNNFPQNFLDELKNLRVNDHLSDVTLMTEGGKLKCHKFVLTASSPYFKKTFKDIVMEQNPIVILLGVKFEDLKAIVSFMYTGEVVVNDEMLSTFLGAAKLLQVKGLSPDVDGIDEEHGYYSKDINELSSAVKLKEDRMKAFNNSNDDEQGKEDSQDDDIAKVIKMEKDDAEEVEFLSALTIPTSSTEAVDPLQCCSKVTELSSNSDRSPSSPSQIRIDNILGGINPTESHFSTNTSTHNVSSNLRSSRNVQETVRTHPHQHHEVQFVYVQCGTCGDHVPTYAMKSHIETQHSTRTESSSLLRSPCSLCGKSFKNKNSLKVHKSIYHRRGTGVGFNPSRPSQRRHSSQQSNNSSFVQSDLNFMDANPPF